MVRVIVTLEGEEEYRLLKHTTSEAQPEIIRAAVFNRALAKKNDWISFLRREKYFDQIRNLLKDAAAKYRSQKPLTEKEQKSLQRQLTKLQAELSILQNEAQNKRLAQEFAQKYPGLDYGKTKEEKIAQLQREIDRIQQSMPVGQLQLLVPK
jgi:predicted ribosome quality control (RQC) complex YloA/Tae2 family protein